MIFLSGVEEVSRTGMEVSLIELAKTVGYGMGYRKPYPQPGILEGYTRAPSKDKHFVHVLHRTVRSRYESFTELTQLSRTG